MGDHVVLFVEECNPSVPQCRICHEEEEDDPKSLESPCACSGTLKYAHRKCIQRWCNEKGDTVCEICLQKFEPGYTAPAKTEAFGRLPLLIRGEPHSPRDDLELQNPGLIAIVAADSDFLESNYRESSLSTFCRSVALTFTVLLLIRHVVILLADGGEQYAFTLFTEYDGLENERDQEEEDEEEDEEEEEEGDDEEEEDEEQQHLPV
ncbi:E3 ubiquitin-protein ligase [Nymphaea thermarum]|nr:E3 ubiquitin-protein ligase [Nymphaea thermarum]